MFSLPYIIAGIIGTSGLVLLIASLGDWLMLRKKDTQKQAEAIQNQKLSIEIEKAQKHAQDIVSTAVDKAAGIVSEASVFETEIVTNLNTQLRQIAQQSLHTFTQQAKQFDTQYQFMFNHIQEEYAQKTAGTIRRMEEVATAELQEFKDLLRKETIASQHFISEKIQTEFSDVQKEIAQYRETKYKEIDGLIAKSIQEITEEILGKSFSPTDHEQLILSSLEKAKQEGMFETEHLPT